jgi:L-ascorbate metabolism protein UlaG (beta-lactamase superfamily)
MSEVRADIALLPVSGTYVMTAEEAVEAVKILGPALAIPMHVGRGIGSLEDATRFKELSPVLVRVLSME